MTPTIAATGVPARTPFDDARRREESRAAIAFFADADRLVAEHREAESRPRLYAPTDPRRTRFTLFVLPTHAGWWACFEIVGLEEWAATPKGERPLPINAVIPGVGVVIAINDGRRVDFKGMKRIWNAGFKWLEGELAKLCPRKTRRKAKV